MSPQSCPLFHTSALLRHLRAYEEWGLYECSDCGVQFWWPLVHPGEEFYEAPIFRHGRLQWRQKEFLKHPPVKTGRILDVGCGLGNFLAAAEKKGFEAWGFDIAENNIHFIKETYRLKNVFVDDLKNFLKRTDIPKFDIVTMFELIEHVESPNELLQDIKKLLAPEGYIVITTPNLRRLGGPFDIEDLPPHHFWRWGSGVIKRLVEQNGFRATRVVEQPLGKDFLWLGLHRIHAFNNLKVRMMHAIAVFQGSKETGGREAHSKPEGHPTKKEFFFADALVVLKDVFAYIISIPLIIIGRIFGWKYWDQYIEAQAID